ARWLAGYIPVEAEPGEAVTAVVRVPARALRHWSQADRGWRVEPGAYRVLVGPSAGKLPLAATVEV
ncbi:fibronectin type III-like domain-contianing protein, partial [Streptomyces sp. URMC 126]